jgi:uncharacterized protein (TIGR01777 family)
VSKVVVTGATGLIGSAVIAALVQRGDTVTALSRDRGRLSAQLRPGLEAVSWPLPDQTPPPPGAIVGAEAVINLLGEPISQRWTPAVKERIRSSRIATTRNLVAAIRASAAGERPKVLVSQSATGYYGPRGDEQLTESAGAGDDFLASIVKEWEAEADAAAQDGVRVICTRTGVVLAPEGGALTKMLPPFRLGIGGPIGGGRQYLPWIHLDDVVGGILHCLDTAAASGPVNLTAPAPATNRDFSRALGHALHRPALAPVPALALKLLYGEMSTIVLTGQRAVPARLRELGYEFRHPDLERALTDVLARRA